MLRVSCRPEALLDGSPVATELYERGLDFALQLDETQITSQLGGFVVNLALLSDMRLPRMIGGTAQFIIGDEDSPRSRGINIMGIQGEAPSVIYGFWLEPEAAAFIGISRLTDDGHAFLGWVDVENTNALSILEVDMSGEVEDPARRSELVQLLSIGMSSAIQALK
jgi:hypothetical protein